MAQTMRQQPPHRRRPARRLPKTYSIISDDFWLVVASAHLAEAIEIQGPVALSIFFSTLKSPPITTHKRPPHTFLPGRVSYRTPPLPMTPSFCSLLCRPNERRPSKTGAPPISHFFDGRLFGAPNKGTNNGESATDAVSLLWAHKEQLHRDLGPWRMLPWRERTKAAEW